MNKKFFLRNKITLSLFVLSLPLSMVAAVTEEVVVSNNLVNILSDLFLIIGGVVVVATIAYLYYFVFLLMQVQKESLYKEKGLEIENTVDQPSIFKRLYDWSIGMVPIEKEKDIMLDHDYDGIQELDNNLPPWWLAMFYICIVIGFAYLGYYHYYDYGLSSREAYAQEMEFAKKARERFLEGQANAVNETNVVMLTEPNALAGGESIFQASCAACHGKLGEGLVGPNLTDDYWIHGGDIKSVFKTVKHGVPQKGMIAWKTQMSPSSIHQVSSFIMTLRGTNPPNAKATQGTLYAPEEGDEGG